MKKYQYEFKDSKTGKTIIMTRQKMIDYLAENVYYDTDYIGGWCGITCANYSKAESEVRRLTSGKTAALIVVGIGTFRAFKAQ